MIPQLLLFITAFAYSFSPEITELSPIATMIAHLLGPLVATFAIASCFPSLGFLRRLNTAIGLALVLSPLGYKYLETTALIIQAVTGLWMIAFSLMAKPLFETGGWRRVIRAPIEESDIDWA